MGERPKSRSHMTHTASVREGTTELRTTSLMYDGAIPLSRRMALKMVEYSSSVFLGTVWMRRVWASEGSPRVTRVLVDPSADIRIADIDHQQHGTNNDYVNAEGQGSTLERCWT